MAELSDVVEVIEITNAKLGDIELKIDDMKLLMDNQALHNINEEIYFVDQDLHSGNIDLELAALQLKIDLINENLLLVNDSQGGYLKEEILSNNDWYYNQVSEINTKISYSFVFLGVIAGVVLAFVIISIFFKRLL